MDLGFKVSGFDGVEFMGLGLRSVGFRDKGYPTEAQVFVGPYNTPLYTPLQEFSLSVWVKGTTSLVACSLYAPLSDIPFEVLRVLILATHETFRYRTGNLSP